MPPANSRAVAALKRRETILRVASRLFAEMGYASTTVRTIADNAGILSGSLYHHFPSKESILREILTDYLDTLTEEYTSSIDGDISAQDALNNLVTVTFEMIAQCPHSAALYQSEAPHLHTEPEFEFLELRSRQIEVLWREQLGRGQVEGSVNRTIHPALAYRFIRDALWSTVHWYQPDGAIPLETLQEQFSLLLHGLYSTAD